VIDRDGLRDVAPVLVGLAPFALLIGVRIAEEPGPDIGGLSGSLLLYAGSAQLSALTLLAQGASTLSVLMTVSLINARFMMYGAALAPRFEGQPTWFRWTAPHFIVDQTFGLATARRDLATPARFRQYWFTTAGAIAVVWVTAMAVGVVLGPAIPDTAAASFVPICVLIGLLVPALTSRPAVAAALSAAAIAASLPLSGGARVLTATVAGAIVGRVVEARTS
jgi:predicted branched-subunit amino acid permease